MTQYFRPILREDAPIPPDAYCLAGGWCWFESAEVWSRSAAPKVVRARDVPDEVLQRLTAPRAAISGVSMISPQIMGILNVTPDSFSDGGRFNDLDAATKQAQEMIAQGATIIDVGGESTRPGADVVPDSTEIERVVGPISAIRTQDDVAISIDTRKASVAEAAVQAGATMLNDVSAFTFDPAMTKVARETGLPVCLMHAQGDPKTMQKDPSYDNVVLDVYDFLEERVKAAEHAGLDRRNIILDPGIGFGKTVEHNLALLKNIGLFHSLGCSILLGASRKRFIGVLGNAPDAYDRLGGSVAVAVHAVSQGVQILRVHDTFATKQAIDLHLAMTKARV